MIRHALLVLLALSCAFIAAPAVAGPPYSCTVDLGGSCGPYPYHRAPMSNGYNSYVGNQPINVHGTETVSANNLGDWQVVANLDSCGGCVQTFPDSQQLTNDWCGDVTNWSTCPDPTDTPLASLATLKVHYEESAPADGSKYEFAPDIWNTQYPSDVMFWVDTVGRCDDAGPVIGHAQFGGQTWTVHQFGAGGEIIFTLDGAGGSGTCANQSAGTVNIKAGFGWLISHGVVTPDVMLAQVNTGFEITESDGQPFTVTRYSILVS